MTDDIDKLVESLQEAILAGYSQTFKNELFNPKNVGTIENPDSHVRITGVCGDTVEMSLTVIDQIIYDVKFTTNGCGATVVCASYVTRTAQGKSVKEALQIEPEDVDQYFEGLPEQHKHCAKLAVVTLRALLDDYCNKSKQGNIGGVDVAE